MQTVMILLIKNGSFPVVKVYLGSQRLHQPNLNVRTKAYSGYKK